jgi:hypothetical protein
MLILPFALVFLEPWLPTLAEARSTPAAELPAPFFQPPFSAEPGWYPNEGTLLIIITGGFFLFLITVALSHREPVTITTYNPTACLSAWASYITDDFNDVSRWQRNWLDIASWKIERADDWRERIAPFMITTQFPSYSATTFWKPAPTPKQCDGVERVVWASESTATTFFDDFYLVGDNATGLPAEITNPWLRPAQRFPVCDIHSEDCESQWALFQGLFSNWTNKIGNINPFIEVTNPTCLFHSEMMCFPESLLQEQFNISSWMVIRGYQSARGFLSNCPQFEDICKRGTDLYKGVARLFSEWNGCSVQAGRFALLYFKQPNNVTRDICANDGWGEDVKIQGSNSTDPVTNIAVVESVVFERGSQAG